MSDTYTRAGVNIQKGDELVQRLRTKNSAIGGFAGLHVLNSELGLVACTDGIGTKIELGIRFHKIRALGQDLVAMCVNDLAVTGAQPLFFLDYFATSKLDVDQAECFIEGVRDAAESVGAALLGGETAEMPGFYNAGHFDAAGFAVGLVDPKRMIDGSTIQPGDALVALPSSGFHSNGYSLIRKILADNMISPTALAPETQETWSEVLTRPTRLYVRDAQRAKQICDVRGMAHITGGGLSNIDRILPDGLEKNISLAAVKAQTPQYMQELAKLAGMTDEEALGVWNMGVGFVFAIPESETTKFLESFAGAFRLGSVQTIGT